MIRWWDDPSKAAGVLEHVDGSDVLQGVGTAVLGYHAIAKAALAPLATETLVDPTGVWEVLAGLDLEPVAKALAAATEPVMGPASGQYGRMLAADIHEQAQVGLETLMAQMGATGIPMPWVVERAIDVVGVPPRHLGGYSKVAKERVVAPAVRTDAADRALMEYAKRVGEREAGSGEVAKAAWSEAKHPRDDDGKFEHKGARPSRLLSLSAVARRHKDARARRAVTSAPAAAPAPKASLSDLAALARAVPAREAREVPAVAEQVTGERVRGEKPKRKLSAVKPAAVAAAEAELPLPHESPAGLRGRGPNRATDQGVAEQLGTATALLRSESGRDLTMLSAIDPRSFSTDGSAEFPFAGSTVAANGSLTLAANTSWAPNLVAHRFVGDVPVAEVHGSDEEQTATLAPGARWVLKDIEQDGTALPSEYGEDQYFDTYVWELANPEQFEGVQINDAPVVKAVEEWHVGGRHKLVSVNRDTEGQFSESATGGGDSRVLRMARQRKVKARRRASREAALSTAPVAERTRSLADLASLASPQRQVKRRAAQKAPAVTGERVRGEKPKRSLRAGVLAATPLAAFEGMDAMVLSSSEFTRAFGHADKEAPWGMTAADFVSNPDTVTSFSTDGLDAREVLGLGAVSVPDALLRVAEEGGYDYRTSGSDGKYFGDELGAYSEALLMESRAHRLYPDGVHVPGTQLNPSTGLYTGTITSYDKDELDVTVYADKEVMAAARRGAKVRLVPVTAAGATTVSGVLESANVSLDDLGTRTDAPVIAFRAVLVHHGRNKA